MPYELYKGLAFTTIWLENTYFQKKMQGESVCTGSFFLTKLHESNSRGFAQQEKKRKIQLITGVDCIAPFIPFLFMEYVIVPGRKGTVMKRIITFDKKVL